MAYATGVSSNPNDLVQKVVAFLVANGWTQDTSTADISSWKACVHKGSTYANMRSVNNEYGTTVWGGSNYSTTGYYGLNLYLGTANGAGSSPWYNGAGAPVGSGQTYKLGVTALVPSGPVVAYHFFLDAAGDNFIGVVERTPGVFVHFGFGRSIDQAGSWTGGDYFFGTLPGFEANYANPSDYGVTLTTECPFRTYPNVYVSGCTAFLRADVDSFTSKWISLISTMSAAYGYTGRFFECGLYKSSQGSANYPRMDGVQDRSHNTFNGSPVLLPILLYGNRDAGGYSLLGSVPSIYATTAVGNGNNPGDEITIGSDTYKLFPAFAVKKV